VPFNLLPLKFCARFGLLAFGVSTLLNVNSAAACIDFILDSPVNAESLAQFKTEKIASIEATELLSGYGSSVTRYRFTSGLLVQSAAFEDPRRPSFSDTTFSYSGELLMKSVEKRGSGVYTTQFKYDSSRRKILENQVLTKIAVNTPIYTIDCSYAKGIVNETKFEKESNGVRPSTKRVYKLDAAERVIEVDIFGEQFGEKAEPGELESKIKVIHNKDGSSIYQIFKNNSEGKFSINTILKFDKLGRKVSAESGVGGMAIKLEYSYTNDTQGNWIALNVNLRSAENPKGILTSRITRKIIYSK
jgi:hypothetical protein